MTAAAVPDTDLDPLAAPRLDYFADVEVDVGVPLVLGEGPSGTRRVVPITGGRVRGPGWEGRVLPGGADFQLLSSATASMLDARYGFETDAGDLVYVENRAVRTASEATMARLLRGETVDPREVYFRCSPRFETRSAALGWINERLFIGAGVRHPQQVAMRFYLVR